MIYEFDSYRLDTDRLELWRGDDPVAVEPRAFSLLVYLVGNRDRVVGKDELLETVWCGRIVSDAALSSRINAVRRAVGDNGKRQRVVRTVARRGFRFIAEVSVDAAPAGPAPRERSACGPPADGGDQTDQAPPSSAEKPSVAVLPFLNLSDAPGWEHVADGLTEDIITGLSKSRMFFVISRGSTFALKGEVIDTRRIAADLGVQYVVEGSVRASGDGLRVTAQLVDAVGDRHVWAEQFDAAAFDVFSVQDEITGSIVAVIAPELVAAEIYRVRRARGRRFDTWDRFMRAYWHFSRFTREDVLEAERLCRRGLELDANDAGFHSLLSFVLTVEAFYGWRAPWAQAMQEAGHLAKCAVDLDDHDALALRSLGNVDMYNRRGEDAIHNFRRAIEIDPHEAENHALLGSAFALSGAYPQARDNLELAIRLSPRDRYRCVWFSSLSGGALIAGHAEEALEWANAAVRANPAFAGGYRNRAAACAVLGRDAEARSALHRLLELLPDLRRSQLRERIPIADDADLERYLEALSRAGLAE